MKETLTPAFWAYYRQITGPEPEREFLAILKLTQAHGLTRVTEAVEKAAAQYQYSYQAVRLNLEETEAVEIPLPPVTPKIQVVDLHQYDLLAGGERV